MNTKRAIYVAIAAIVLIILAVSCQAAYAGRCDGNQGNGKGNYCQPNEPTPPANVETDREYTARVHSYAHGNSVAIKHLDSRQEVTEAKTADNRAYIERVHSYAHGNSLGIQSLDKRADALEANKVDRSEFTKDQARQDAALHSVGTRTGKLEARADQTALNIDEVRAVNTRQDSTLATHGTRLDGHDAQFANMANVNAALDTRLGGAYQRLDQHSVQIARLERKMDRADEANAIALAVAGHQFDTKGGFQTAISASTVNGKQALAIGMGGALNDRVFVNAGVSSSGNTTGGVVSSTYSW